MGMTHTPNTLGDYIRDAMIKRFGKATTRLLASGASISTATASNLLRYDVANPAFMRPDPETLNAVAAFLGVPAENLYRLSTLLPEESLRSRLIREIDHLFARLPEADQQEIAMLVRLKAMRYSTDDQEPDKN